VKRADNGRFLKQKWRSAYNLKTGVSMKFEKTSGGISAIYIL